MVFLSSKHHIFFEKPNKAQFFFYIRVKKCASWNFLLQKKKLNEIFELRKTISTTTPMDGRNKGVN